MLARARTAVNNGVNNNNNKRKVQRCDAAATAIDSDTATPIPVHVSKIRTRTRIKIEPHPRHSHGKARQGKAKPRYSLITTTSTTEQNSIDYIPALPHCASPPATKRKSAYDMGRYEALGRWESYGGSSAASAANVVGRSNAGVRVS